MGHPHQAIPIDLRVSLVVFTIVLGPYNQSWRMAMAMIFVEGCLVAILVLTNLREMVMNAIPLPLKYAISVGIGLFIAELSSAIGIME